MGEVKHRWSVVGADVEGGASIVAGTAGPYCNILRCKAKMDARYYHGLENFHYLVVMGLEKNLKIDCAT